MEASWIIRFKLLSFKHISTAACISETGMTYWTENIRETDHLGIRFIWEIILKWFLERNCK
jgi:hypothetical protein